MSGVVADVEIEPVGGGTDLVTLHIAEDGVGLALARTHQVGGVLLFVFEPERMTDLVGERRGRSVLGNDQVHPISQVALGALVAPVQPADTPVARLALRDADVVDVKDVQRAVDRGEVGEPGALGVAMQARHPRGEVVHALKVEQDAVGAKLTVGARELLDRARPGDDRLVADLGDVDHHRNFDVFIRQGWMLIGEGVATAVRDDGEQDQQQ